MLKPDIYDMLNENQCYYSFVIAIAKRAREIIDEYIERGEILENKAVDIAVREFCNGDFNFIEKPDNANDNKNI